MNGTSRRHAGGTFFLLCLGQLLLAVSAYGFPCSGEPVTIGEPPEQVAAKCGEPMLREKRVVTVKEWEGRETRSMVTEIEEWTYSAGPTELMQSYRYENGRLAEIGTPGYGPVQDFSVDNCHNGESLAVGDTPLALFMKCGEPLAREKKQDKVTETTEGNIRRRTAVSVVEWTYRYGPGAPGYTLRLEDGTVAAIRTREFGK
jgi:hypothetical protein